MKNLIEKMKLMHKILLFFLCFYENFTVSHYKIIFLKIRLFDFKVFLKKKFYAFILCLLIYLLYFK